MAARPLGVRLRALSPGQIVIASLLVAVQVAHVAVRPKAWVVDVRWTVDAYVFSLVIFGPIAAGWGAEVGAAACSLDWASRVDPIRAALVNARKCFAVPFAIFLLGLLCVVLATVYSSGFALLPDFVECLVIIGTSAVALVAFVVVGYAVGSKWRNPIATIVAIVAGFAATLAAWIVGADWLVRFDSGMGGNGLHVSYPMAALQAVTWGAVALLAVLLTAGTMQRWAVSTDRKQTRLTAAVLAVVLLCAVVGNNAERLYVDESRWACAEWVPNRTVCVGDRYGRYAMLVAETLRTSPKAVLLADLGGSAVSNLMYVRDSLALSRLITDGDRHGDVATLMSMSHFPGCAIRVERSGAIIYPDNDSDAEVTAAAIDGWLRSSASDPPDDVVASIHALPPCE